MGGCSCFQRRVQVSECNASLQQPRGLLHVAGAAEMDKPLREAFRSYITSRSSFEVGTPGEAKSLVPLKLQEWRTGTSDVVPWQQSTFDTFPAGSQSICPVEYVCYCKTALRCEMDSAKWIRYSQMATPERRLQQETWRVPFKQQDWVRVTFGLQMANSTPLIGDHRSSTWSFRESFKVQDPWAQRDLARFCEEMPKELLVTRNWCWMNEFAKQIIKEGLRFPVIASSFDAVAYEFVSKGRFYRDYYLWLEDAKVKALYFSFQVDLERGDRSHKHVMDLKSKWDRYVEAWNGAAVREASGAVHICKTWKSTAIQTAAVESLVATSAVVLSLAFCGMFVFTRSFVLSLFVSLSTAGVMVGLLFFIVAMSWDIGFVEVVAIVYFAGYAVTYSLHIAHKYCSDEAVSRDIAVQPSLQALARDERAAIRIQRTSYAFTSIGFATMGSAATTAGASFFLVPCTLVLFQKLGSMCLAVVLASAIAAQVFLPAVLLTCGPAQPGCSCDRKKPPSPDDASLPTETSPEEYSNAEFTLTGEAGTGVGFEEKLPNYASDGCEISHL